MFVYVCLCLSLSDVSRASLSISISVVRVCPLSIQRSPELSFYYCLQTSSLSMSNSVTDYLLKLLFEHTNVKFTVNDSFSYVMSKRIRQCLIFWVFVGGEFDKQRVVLYKLEWCTHTCTCTSVFLISLYGTPSYLVLHSSLFVPVAQLIMIILSQH